MSIPAAIYWMFNCAVATWGIALWANIYASNKERRALRKGVTMARKKAYHKLSYTFNNLYKL